MLDDGDRDAQKWAREKWVSLTALGRGRFERPEHETRPPFEVEACIFSFEAHVELFEFHASTPRSKEGVIRPRT